MRVIRTRSYGTTRTPLGRLLLALRRQTGERMEDMSIALGLGSRSALSHIETGRYSPPPDFVDRIAASHALTAEEVEAFESAALEHVVSISVDLREAGLPARRFVSRLAKRLDQVPADLLVRWSKDLEDLNRSAGSKPAPGKSRS